jgi:hypothetical protein
VSLCEYISGTIKSNRYESPVRCNEEATVGRLCPYHARVGQEACRYREFVAKIPMPGYEALKGLAREVGWQ